MKKFYFILTAAASIALASCTNDEIVGQGPGTDQELSEAINFGFKLQNMSRADIIGNSAAELLGNNFYVTGTKGTEAETSPTPTLVFDNYLVHYGINTAGTTASNTANWEYVGVTPGTSPYENYVKLSSLNSQTIKYWDYSVPQYDFLAFSVGKDLKAVATTSVGADEIGVTAMKYGTDLASNGIAYTFDIPSEDALGKVYISDITKVEKANYGKEVSLKFKNIGSKIRVALYETVPGYSVKNVQFYTVDDGTTNFEVAKGSAAALIFSESSPLAVKGKIQVYFPSVGTNNNSKGDYNIATAIVTAGSEASDKTTSKTFGSLKLVADEADEAEQGNYYLGRTLPTASFAGTEAQNFYTSVFPVSTNAPITLRVDYTLVPVDGAAETITVKGAKAVVPSTYTKWLPNYAYTYIFKISDNTNGWTGTASEPSGLFPITFDAVVTEATDAMAEQKTITTVATPTITTYQQNHDITKDEYSKATGKNIYVQVMDNSTATATLKGDLNGTTKDDTNRSLLYAVTNAVGTTPISEANVMDALENQSSVVSENITGRNGLLLTKASISAGVTSIVNGVDNNPITVTAGQAAEIAISVDAGTYAYVYDYTAADKNKVNTNIYQPIAVTGGSAIGVDGQKFFSVATTTLDGIDTSVAANVTTEGEAVNSNSFIYFSKTKNGTSSWTYSFVSVDGKTNLPAGLVKCPVGSLTGDVNGTTTAAANTFYFTKYVRNDGKYAVKIIKIVA